MHVPKDWHLLHKITNVPVFQFILYPKYFSNETSLTFNKVSSLYEIYLQIGLMLPLSFI